MGAIELVEKTQMTERPQMKAGDTVKVHVKVREGDKERIQVFEGIVIGMHRGRRAGVVYRAQGVVRPGRRAHFPAALADHSESGSRALGEGAPREAVLPPRSQGQSRPDARRRRNKQTRADPYTIPAMVRVCGHADARERPPQAGIQPGVRRRRGRPRVPGRPGRRRRRRAAPRSAYSRG